MEKGFCDEIAVPIKIPRERLYRDAENGQFDQPIPLNRDNHSVSGTFGYRNCYHVPAMRKTVFFALVTALVIAGGLQAQTLPPRLEFRHQGLRIETIPVRNHVEVSSIMTLLGGEAAFSASAGVWALSLGEHLVQLAPDRRLVLVNGKLVARGEVVVVDESFGVKITNIIGPMERLTQLN